MEGEHQRVAHAAADDALEQWKGLFPDHVIALMRRELCHVLETEPLGRHLVSRVRVRKDVLESGDVAEDGSFDDDLAEANARIATAVGEDE